MADAIKRPLDDDSNSCVSEDVGWIGPMPSEAATAKKKRVLDFEKVYLENLPCAEAYEKSYMHRDVVTQLVVSKYGFVITASADGHVKFWKKCDDSGIEFVKHFRAHLGVIQELSLSSNGEMCCTISTDKTMKVFDVINFDMINMIRLDYVPSCCAWVWTAGQVIPAIAVSEMESPSIHIYDSKGGGTPMHTLSQLHSQPVIIMKLNPVYDTIISIDKSGMLEYWGGPKQDYQFPKAVAWEYKTDTDLYEFVKIKTVPTCIEFSPNGKNFAALCKDRRVRIFKFLTGKMTKVLDERMAKFSELQQMKQQIPNMEFGRRLAMEKDLEKSEFYDKANIVYDESGHFLLYGTMLGVKIINLHTNRCMHMLGKPENARFLQIGLFQNMAKKTTAAITLEMEASENPALVGIKTDPILFSTAFKKNRFYLFSRREPDDTTTPDKDRDVFNEKPSKEEQMAATQDTTYTRISELVIMHTTLGDIHLKLYPKECPKTVENFCVHSRDGYYNSHIFHRIIKGFMLQTGDPLGNGTGGESIWGGEFEDEFHPTLKHDRPYTVSMANAGENTNGSQFFITVAPTPWLDNKHTVFGHAVKGMDVIQKMSNVKTNPKTDKPVDEIRILSITVK